MNFSPLKKSFVLGCCLLFGCGMDARTPAPAGNVNAGRTAAQPEQQGPVASNTPTASTPDGPRKADDPVPVYTYEVKNTYPHDRAAFTQGLIFRDGYLWESTGQYGSSSLRQVELKTGRVLRSVPVEREFFAEGMTIFGGKVYQLTWQEGRAFVYDAKDFRRLGEFKYAGEGWGLTHDGESLVMSDGTSTLRFLDPETFAVRRTVRVADAGRPVEQLNELEYVRGEIFANVWQEDRVARIDPRTGRVTGWIDLRGLLPAADTRGDEDVLNGIAYDEAGDRLFVTGKLWPKLFEIRLIKK
ncbi:MAG TPA: glutaminyl-peptide cyclotransferase [Pyrinomonadaceae bacterium]|nr:glutaminyl-peptide cyclotransferase [Pyrinomonadaceae bacterium]